MLGAAQTATNTLHFVRFAQMVHYFAGMMWPGQLYAGHPGLQAYRANQQGRGTAAMGAQGAAARAAAQAAARAAANPPVNYTVAYNGDNHRCLCKNCRNPIASNTLRVGYRDRNQMKWFHLGCLPPDQWRQASIPGRLDGLPSLPSAQQVTCQGCIVAMSVAAGTMWTQV